MIKEVDFQKSIEDAFLAYSASVAQERAIPDVRDMLKIGLRQGLYAQYSNKLTHKDKFQKAQKSVAAAMTQSYVHGDVAMYDTFIRAARPWSYRYPLENVQGNFGNPTSPDSHAAARYVEMKAAEISNLLFDGLKKNAIGDEYYPNYDDSEMIPSVFPSIGFWNIVNGCSGIAVALATSVPTFNLKEVNQALIKIIKNPEVSFDEIYCAPDFPTGGTITNAAAVKESLRFGKGESIRIRANLEYIPDQNMIKATELPFTVFTNTIIDQLGELVAENPSYGIERVVDHTKKEADIRIYLTKGVNPSKMKEKLYADTSLENWFSVNMVLLDKGRFPKIFGWRAACDAYIEHIRACKRREVQYDLDKALARKNIVDGLIKAYSIIDEVVALIRGSANPSEASQKLINIYEFNEEQAKAILAMRLSSLTKLDIVKLTEEREELVKSIEWYRYLLDTPSALDEQLIKILQEVANKFGDARRTKVTDVRGEQETNIEEQEIGILLFDNNMLRAVNKDSLNGAQRGRKGLNIKPPKNATLINTIYATNLDSIAILTNIGRLYNLSLSSLEYEQDYSLYDLISLQEKEKALLMIEASSFHCYNSLITVSKNGYIKKTLTREYNTRSKGVAAVKLESNDELAGAHLSMSDEDRIFISNTIGRYNFYSVGDIPLTGRIARGSRAIKLDDGEEVASSTIVRAGTNYRGILTIGSDGCGKITPIDEFSMTSKGVKGNAAMALTDTYLCLGYAVDDQQDTIYITANNKAVKINIADIPISNRVTKGARLMDLRSGLKNKLSVM